MTARASALLSLCVPVLLLAGCGVGPLAAPSAETGAAIKGIVHGGQQPIAGSHVYLLAANTTGYGGSGIAASPTNASVPLLQYADTGLSDAIGAYVLTDSGGNFSISGDYSCTPGQQVYLYAKGGNPGAGVNASVGLMAILGSCPAADNFAAATPSVVVNEVSTIAAAYAFAGFASDATHVSSSGTTLAQTGILNAFANAGNLVTLGTGTALATTPAGNGVAPQTTVNTLANILATCVNTADVYSNSTYVSPSSGCSTLLGTATLDGTATGTQPTDTASAAINIAHFPGSNVSTLFVLPSPTAPFSPALGTTTTPNDLTLAIGFNGGGIREPYFIAIDGYGNVWVTNKAANALSEFSPTGAALSSTTGFTGGGVSAGGTLAIDPSNNVWELTVAYDATLAKVSNAGTPYANSPYTGLGFVGSGTPFAIDASGDVWIPNEENNSIAEYSNAGVAYTNSPYTGGGLSAPQSIAIDGTGNVWVGNKTSSSSGSISEFSSAGSPITTVGYTGGGFYPIESIVIDSAEDVWATSASASDVYTCKINSAGSPLCPANGYPLQTANIVSVIDGGGNLWDIDGLVGGVSELSNAGVLLGPSTGYYAGSSTAARPFGIAVDGSGNLWETSSGSISTTYNRVWEFVGIAVPVVTPLSASVAAPYNKPASKP